MSTTTTTAAILGCGISGLSQAWFLRQLLPTHVKVVVIEATDRAGGWIKTTESDGFLFEHGARGFRPARNGAETLQLIEDLHLQDEMISSSERAKSRFIFRDNQITKLPTTFRDALRWHDAPLFARALLREPFVSVGFIIIACSSFSFW